MELGLGICISRKNFSSNANDQTGFEISVLFGHEPPRVTTFMHTYLIEIICHINILCTLENIDKNKEQGKHNWFQHFFSWPLGHLTFLFFAFLIFLCFGVL